MQLMSDVLTVLGSRHGIFIEPVAKRAHVVRTGRFPGLPCEIRAGIVVDGTTCLLPLCAESGGFDLLDQDTSPCSMTLTGVHADSASKLELVFRIPFRPRDAEFSTTPVIDIELRALPLGANFRWRKSTPPVSGEVFLEIYSPAFGNFECRGDEIRWETEAECHRKHSSEEVARKVVQRDALVAHEGVFEGTRLTAKFAGGKLAGASLRASWCVHSEPVLAIRGGMAPFKYSEKFASLDAVVECARREPAALAENAARVDGIFRKHNLSPSVDNLMANTLHSWLANTWWVLDGGRDAFSVWEGSCYYHSTVDVEYTQTPFYLAVWPELLGIELDQWPRFTVDGGGVIGERGVGKTVFMHDMGEMCEIDTTRYNHHMPVEENSNYVLMSYAYWRRSGDDSRIKRHAESIRGALEFIAACDSTGNGVPNKGMANTIDDASPAVQFGKEQIYLAVKALAAFDVGTEMLRHAGLEGDYTGNAATIAAVIKDKGWLGDHFATLLDKSAHGVVNSWSNTELSGDEIPGWDAAHIYTANGLALLDMVGRKVDVDEERLRVDLRVATRRCLDKYGCRHSDHAAKVSPDMVGGEGDAGMACRVGWISMNMMRDISAFYRGVDLRAMSERYWLYQVLTNTQGAYAFFETFNGNNLMCYPRGVAVFGFFDALAGATIDRVAKKLRINPLDAQIEVPLLAFADWRSGDAPLVKDGKLLGSPRW